MTKHSEDGVTFKVEAFTEIPFSKETYCRMFKGWADTDANLQNEALEFLDVFGLVGSMTCDDLISSYHA